MKRTITRRLGGTGRFACATLLGASCAALAQAAEPAAVDPAVQALTQPASSFEIGIGDVTADSFKFGQYNGLEKKGAYGVGDLDVRGGGSYDSADTTRWRISGNDLGLRDRSASAEYGKQGLFRISFGYDELRDNRSDSFSTPYLGAGSDIQTLPSSWIVPVVPRLSAGSANARGLSSAVAASSGIVTGVLAAPSAAQLAVSNALIAADLPLFHNYDLYTTRERYNAGLLYQIAQKWDFSVNAERMNRTGAKPMGSVTRATGGDISTSFADPIDQTTDQITATLGYRTKKDFVQFSYYGSKFSNNVSSVSWTNWALPSATGNISSAPGNQWHQFALSAGHDFTPGTRLVANASYARSTQDDAFIVNSGTPLVPAASLDGLVVQKQYGLRLTARPSKELNLAAGYKHDERDNRTPVRIFGYYDANDTPAASALNANFATALLADGLPAAQVAALKSNVNINASRPYSRKNDQINADADYRITATQAIKAGYEWQRVERWCDGSWIDCVNAGSISENGLKLEWRANPLANLSTSLSYNGTKRTVDSLYNENAFLALVPLANVSPTGATGGASAYSYMIANGWTGYGPVAGYAATAGNANLFFPLNNAMNNAQYQNGNRISELIGMRMYNQADRKRNRVRGTLDFEPTETVSLQGSAEYRKDDYDASRYGLIASRDWSLNLEGSWKAGENTSLTASYTHENQASQSAGNSYTANSAAANVGGFTAISGGCFATIATRNASNKIDPCLNWSTDMTNVIDYYGLSIDQRNLLKSKLDLGAQLVVTKARSGTDVYGGNYVNNPYAVAGAPAGTIAAYFVPSQPLPDVTTQTVELRLNARYAISPKSWARFTYIYGDMSSSDYAYDGLQIGGLAGVLPTGESAPHYVVHVFALSYGHQF